MALRRTAKTSLLMTSLLIMMTSHVTSACNIDEVRASVGGWSSVAGSDPKVQELLVSIKGHKGEATALEVLESYKQVIGVHSVNYCVRFTATGNCSEHYCQSVECTAGGTQPMSQVDGTEASVTQSVQCHTFPACDIERTRDISKTPMPGGWFVVELNDQYITQLHDKALTAAAVRDGVVVEAYSQTVAGRNFCIQFDSTGSARCNSNCQPLSCIARGHLPLPPRDTNITQVGVTCQPGGSLEGYTGRAANNLATSITSLMVTSSLALIVRRFFG